MSGLSGHAEFKLKWEHNVIDSAQFGMGVSFLTKDGKYKPMLSIGCRCHCIGDNYCSIDSDGPQSGIGSEREHSRRIQFLRKYGQQPLKPYLVPESKSESIQKEPLHDARTY